MDRTHSSDRDIARPLRSPQAPITVIGIDCAVDPRKVGLSRATSHGEELYIHEVERSSKKNGRRPAEIAAAWISAAPGQVLIALDAPLGWPERLGKTLAPHRAGDPISILASDLFHRYTDAFIRCHVGQRPLDVGADRIAHTARAALELLYELGRSLDVSRIPNEDHRLGREAIPLAWDPLVAAPVQAIEVYPAATRRAHSFDTAPTTWASLEGLLCGEPVELQLTDAWPAFWSDGRDAVLCALAAHDFLRGLAMAPVDQRLAQKEGWIWVRRPVATRCTGEAADKLAARLERARDMAPPEAF